jgi:hypothetical protein
MPHIDVLQKKIEKNYFLDKTSNNQTTITTTSHFNMVNCIHPDHKQYFKLLKLSPNDIKLGDFQFNNNLIFSSYIDISSQLYQEQNDIIEMSNKRNVFFTTDFTDMVDNIFENFEKKQIIIKEAYQILENEYGIPEVDDNVYYTETGKFITIDD